MTRVRLVTLQIALRDVSTRHILTTNRSDVSSPCGAPFQVICTRRSQER